MKVNSYTVDMSAHYRANITANDQEENIEQKDTLSASYEENTTVHKTPEVETKTKDIKKQLEREMTTSVLSRVRKSTYVDENAGLQYDYMKFNQKSNISMQGTIKTDQGDFAVDIDVKLSSAHRQIQVSEMIDPLVINLNGTMPGLSSNTFEFDLDMDGEVDQISQLRAGNGFLALDKNDNNTIDDGSELFGPTSGSGMSELKLYDEDGNGFIDENDPIFDKLRVWMTNDSESRLVALGEVGIGAIFIEGVSNNFIQSSGNDVQGLMKNSSFVLFENGKTSIMAEYDLKKFGEIKEEVQSNVGSLQQINNARSIFDKDTSIQSPLATNNTQATKAASERMEKLLAQLSKLKSKLKNEHDPDERQKIQVQIAKLQGQLLA